MAGVDYLAFERNKAQFDVDELKIVWAGSREEFELSDRISRLVANDPVFRKDDRASLDRKELFKNTLRKAAYAWKKIIELRLTEQEANKLRTFVDQPAFTDLHWGMFVPALKGQGTDEQQAKWLPLANKMQIIGCYAQTELGHGSNVQGLETTATFDPETDEFVIHSPTLTSSKWWPGGLGKISTHAIVYARLITDGQDQGVHGFIVQLRSLDDHLPLAGITVGDIGMKFGNAAYNSMDNGVLSFDHVRIPRNQMLMRVSQVTREGKYVQSSVPRQLIYGTMVYVRQAIVADASTALSRAVCIATRYSAVRRQFGSQNGGLETQVIDYKTQQARLFPLLASAYAFRFVSEWLKWLYTDVTQRLQANDFSTLPEAHACTAGLKSLTTIATAADRGSPGIVPSSLFPFDVSVVLRGPYWIRIMCRKQFAVDMRCFAGDHVWLQPATPPKEGRPSGGSLPCFQFQHFIMEHVTQELNGLDLSFTGQQVGGLASSKSTNPNSGTQLMGANRNRINSAATSKIRYQEANSTVYTTVIFPFLFAMMFGTGS